jgi:hypothetical protein
MDTSTKKLNLSNGADFFIACDAVKLALNDSEAIPELGADACF